MLGAQNASGTPYEVLYDANVDGVFPEDLGWERWTTGGGVSRTVQDGIFTLAAINPAPNGGSDLYRWDGMEMLNPDPGEVFYAEWRMRVLPQSNDSDVNVFIATDGMQRAFSLLYSVFGMRSTRDNREILMDMTVFRVFRIESPDMVGYTMTIDNVLAWEGFFGTGTTRTSEVYWGDGLVGSASTSEWNYFKFGVIPEPSCLRLLGMAVVATPRRRGIAFRSSVKEDISCAVPPYS